MKQKEIRQSYDKIILTSLSESEVQSTSDNEVNDVVAEE